MRSLLLYICIAATLISCSTSKKLQYNFESQNIVDSVTAGLQKYQNNHGGDFLKVKWFALVRNTNDGFEIIINENTGKENFPFKSLIKKTNRFINVGNQLNIPVIFDIDFISDDFKKITRGTVNFGGYFFKIIKDETGQYRVSETGVLF